MTRPSLPWLLPLLLALVLASAAGWPPVVDEESYLDIANQLAAHPARPYDWFRPWQPWGATPPENAYLFAHPPLHLWWLSAWSRVFPPGPGLRLAVGLPWALLLGWAAASLAQRSRAPRGAWVWLLSPVVVLGLQSSWMIDLPVLALGAAGLAAWQRAAQAGDTRGADTRWALGAGLLLGLAACTKYPALVLLPVLALDAQRRHMLRRTAPVWLGVALTWGALEASLYAQYGAVHVNHVLETAGQIGRGPLLGRLAGTLVRLGLLVSPALALLCGRRALAGGLASALFAMGVVQGQLDWGGVLACGALAFAGGAMGAEALCGESGELGAAGAGQEAETELGAVTEAESETKAESESETDCELERDTEPPPAPRRSPQTTPPPDERPLLQLWLIAAVLAVALGHNYVGGRYLLPAALPLALLLAQRMKHVSTHVLMLVLLLSAGLAAAMSHAEARYARAAVALADATHAAALAQGRAPGWFTGEWSFRWRMQQLGWRFYAGGPLPPGALLARPANASPGPLPEPLILLDALQSPERGGLKLIDLEAGVGYHAETLGPLPLAVTPGPVESVALYEVP